MRTVSYRLGDLARATINIGKVAENEYTRVQFNAEQIFAEYPAATAALSVINPAGTAYPAVVTREGDLIIWDVTDADLTAAGMGELQLTLTENGVVIKSYIARTRIERSIVASGSTPDPVQNWLDNAAEVLEEVEDAIPAGGTQGQVMGKLSDDDYDIGWIDQTGGGGGGGTSNYNELSNKPKINGTTLSGNKSLADLGAASAEAVNAKYTKPASGIPASDLASGVQTSLGKADTAYQKPSGGVPSSDMASAVQTSLVKADTAYQKPGSGIPASDLASGVIPTVHNVPAGGSANQVLAKNSGTDYDLKWVNQSGGGGGAEIDDTAGEGDTTVVWSADKTWTETEALKNAIAPLTPAATSGDVGKFMKVKTVADGKVTAYEFGSGGGGGGAEIDDTAGIGDTTVTWSANKSATEIANLTPAAPETVSWIDKTYINSSGVAETDNSYEATDYIDITDAVAISYAGRMGSSKVCFWYNSSKTFLSSALVLDDRTAYYENVMTYKPENAKYLRLQSKKTTATNPPAVTPEVTVFYDPKYVERLAENIVGDGATDDTNAVQRIVNVGEFVKFPRRDRILITGTIDVRMGYARILDGNGCNIVVDDDFYALTVTGTLAGATEATGMPVRVVEDEAAMLIKNFRITSEDITEGGGIQITKSFRAKLCDNYIHHMKNGIRVYGQNRDMIISNNQMITFTNNGILFDQGINLHQCNIFGNMLTYAHDVICIDQPQAIANFQITGNDIEILNYPASTYGTAKCIYFKSVSNCQQFSEIEIVGNSIQGHGSSAFIIALDGVASYEIKNVTICGNHISNSNDCAISLENVQNITINGNNYAAIKHFVYELDGTCENIMISGESGIGINEGTVAAGGKLHAASTATLSGVKCKNVQFSNDTVSLETSGLTDVDVWDEKDVAISAPSATITAVPNERYVFGTVSTLSFTPCSKGVCGVVFTSGSTPTTLTIPNTVKWSDDFDPSDLDASTTYELSILNGTMGVAAKWA